MDPNDSAWKTGAFSQFTQASILVITDFLIPTVIYALAYFRMLKMFPTNQFMRNIAWFWQDERGVVWEQKYRAAYDAAAHKTADEPPLAGSGPVTSKLARMSSQISRR